MKQKMEWKFVAGTLLLLLCLLCAGCVDTNDTKADEQQVYITYGTNRTTNDWQLEYSAVSRDGVSVLPLEQRQILSIYDDKTGEQLWLQTREQYVDDPTIKAEDLYVDNNWEHIHSIYTLHDLEGNVVQELGERFVQTVYGDWILYSDGKLERRSDGMVLFDDINEFYVVDGYCLMNSQWYSKVQVTDDNLQVLWERDGSGSLLQADTSDAILLRQEDGLVGVVGFDGSEILPCQYDYINRSSSAGRCIARQDDKHLVVSLQDGSVLYETTEPDKEIYYADDTVLLQRTWEIVSDGIHDMQVQMYNYDGQAISDVYQYLSEESELLLPEQNKLFSAGTVNGEPVLLNQQGQEIYRGAAGTWLNSVTADRVIVSDSNKAENAATLQTLDGKVLNQKAYNGMYPVYYSIKEYPYSQKSSMVIGNYNFGNTVMLDLIDADGNILIEQAKSIQTLDKDRFWVEKGFSQGLMDREGNWLYEQSLFDTTVDE